MTAILISGSVSPGQGHDRPASAFAGKSSVDLVGMLTTIGPYLRFQWKRALFSYRTWRNRRAIAKAYASPWSLPEMPRWLLRPTLVCSALVAILAIVCLVAPDARRGVFQAVRAAYDGVHERLRKPDFPEAGPRLPQDPSQPVSLSNSRLTSPRYPSATLATTSSPQSRTSTDLDFFIVANKSTRTMYLLRQADGQSRLVDQYSMAVGEEDGQKQIAGDKRTPTGYYYIIGRKEGYELTPEYGPLVFILNYPNEDDLKAGRNGGGILIHGSYKGATPEPTKGCLELYNRDLRKLASFLKLGIGTPVVIVDIPDLADPASVPDYSRLTAERSALVENYRAAHQKLASFVSGWEGAWEARDIDQYSRFYDTATFQAEGLDWAGWRARKERTFRSYRKIEVTVQDVVLTELSDSTATVKFRQKYASDSLQVEGAKKLSLAAAGDAWRITGEIAIPQQEGIP